MTISSKTLYGSVAEEDHLAYGAVEVQKVVQEEMVRIEKELVKIR